jgi:hypothetical protein
MLRRLYRDVRLGSVGVTRHAAIEVNFDDSVIELPRLLNMLLDQAAECIPRTITGESVDATPDLDFRIVDARDTASVEYDHDVIEHEPDLVAQVANEAGESARLILRSVHRTTVADVLSSTGCRRMALSAALSSAGVVLSLAAGGDAAGGGAEALVVLGGGAEVAVPLDLAG